MNLPESPLEVAWAVAVALMVALLAVAVVACLLRGQLPTIAGLT